MVNSKKLAKSNKFTNGNMPIMARITKSDENGTQSGTNLDELNSGFSDYLRSSEGVC